MKPYLLPEPGSSRGTAYGCSSILLAAPLRSAIQAIQSLFCPVVEEMMRLTKSNRKKAQYFVNLLRNPQSFAPASLQALFQRIEADPTLRWMTLSSYNNLFLHSQCPGRDWVCYEMRDGSLEETFYPSYFVKNGYRYEYIGTLNTVPFDWPNRPNLVTLDVKFFLHLFDAYAMVDAAAERKEAAARQRAAVAAGQAGAAVSQIPGITSGDAGL